MQSLGCARSLAWLRDGQNQPTGSLNLSVVWKLPRSLLEHCKAFLPESRHLRIRKSQTPQIRFCFFRAKRPGIVDKFFRGRRKKLIAGLQILRRIVKNQVIGRRPVLIFSSCCFGMWQATQLSGGEVDCLLAKGARQDSTLWQVRHRSRKSSAASAFQ